MDATYGLEAFVRTVERGSFSAAARDLDLTPSALSKLVARLEHRLGARLLQRSTRALTLTAEGEAYYGRARRILAEIAEAEHEVASFNERPRGLLRAHVSVAFGTYQLVPSVQAFIARFPEIKLELTISDRPVDFTADGTDIAIGTSPAGDAATASQTLCDLERIVCASPAYLAAYGTPSRPEDLAQHNCLTLDRTSPGVARWPFRHGKSVREIAVTGNVVANNADTLVQLAQNGVGIIRLSDLSVGNALRTGRLVPLLTALHWPEPLPLVVLYPEGRQRTPCVAAMLDFLFKHFAHAPWRAPPARRGGAP
jgi:DNA-binding transcriptional LysR family regulator